MNRNHLILLGALLLVFPSSSRADGERVVLGMDGEPVRLLRDSYGELFPLGSQAHPRDSVLALERTLPDRTTRFELVPGTEGPDFEAEFSLYFDRGSDSFFVFWQARQEDAAALNLIRLDRDGIWSEVIEVSEDRFSWKSAPRLIVTQESAPTPPERGDAAADRRTLFHLIWSEERPAGERVLYAPLVLEDGSYLGSHRVFDLTELAAPAPVAEAPTPTRSMVEAPTIAAGRDGRTVVVALTDPETRTLSTVEIEALSRRLIALADGGRANIDIVGVRGSIHRLAQETRDYILDASTGFHPAVSRYIADRVYDSLLAAGSGPEAPDDGSLGELARREILAAGAEFEDEGLMEDGGAPFRILEITGPETAGQVLRLRTVSTRPVPATAEAPTRVFVSRSGRDVLVCWAAGAALEFRETRGPRWSGVQRLEIGERLPLGAAYELLERRVRGDG